jgi:hypothetical protein
MAASALRISRSTVLTRSDIATPMLAAARKGRPSMSKGSLQASNTWRATAMAASSLDA